jgi:hypothetical protein
VRSLKKEGIRQATTAMIFERTYATLARYNIVEKFGGHLDSEDAYQILINYFFSEEHLYEDLVIRYKFERQKQLGPSIVNLLSRWEREGFPPDKNQRRLEIEPAKKKNN